MDTDDKGGDDDLWPNGRKAVTYREARTVLDRQHSDLADIDDKALQTVRVLAVIIGATATAAGVLNVSEFNPVLLYGGGASLALALGVGILTYSESDLYLGPGRRYVEQLAENSTTDLSWDEDLLYSMAYWIEKNNATIEWNGRLLLLTQSLLYLGLVAVGLSVVI